MNGYYVEFTAYKLDGTVAHVGNADYIYDVITIEHIQALKVEIISQILKSQKIVGSQLYIQIVNMIPLS